MMRALGSFERLVSDRSAASAVTIALALPAFIAATALTIDTGVAYVTRTGLQNTADASALAGVSALPDTADATATAIAAATANMPVAKYGNVLLEADVRTGYWDEDARTFTPDGVPLNAVEVVTRRATANNNALPSFFAGALGRNSFNVNARAVATIGGGSIDDCLRNGYIADGKLEFGSDVAIQGDTCVHGQEGIKVGSDVVMTGGGVDVTYGVGSNFEGQGNSGNNIPAPKQEDKTFPVDIDAILDSFLSNPSDAPQPEWGPWDVVTRNGDWKPSRTQCAALNGSHDLFIVTGKVELTECTTLSGFAVFATKEIILPSGSSSPNQFKMQDMYFASNDLINVGSNVDIGSSNYCDDGSGSSFFIARNKIIFQSDVRMWGVQIISGASGPTSPGIELGDDIQSEATAVWSAGYLKLGSNPNLNGGSESDACDRDDHILTHSANLALRLVD